MPFSTTIVLQRYQSALTHGLRSLLEEFNVEAFEKSGLSLYGVRARAKKSTIGGRDDAHLHYPSDPLPTFRVDQPIMHYCLKSTMLRSGSLG